MLLNLNWSLQNTGFKKCIIYVFEKFTEDQNFICYFMWKVGSSSVYTFRTVGMVLKSWKENNNHLFLEEQKEKWCCLFYYLATVIGSGFVVFIHVYFGGVNFMDLIIILLNCFDRISFWSRRRLKLKYVYFRRIKPMLKFC